jgi:hypothetical protein
MTKEPGKGTGLGLAKFNVKIYSELGEAPPSRVSTRVLC